MDLFELRRNEVRNALVDLELIDETTSFALGTHECSEEPIRFFSELRGNHQLIINGYADGEMSVAILALDGASSKPVSFLALVTTAEGNAWSVILASDFVETCTRELFEIWDALPQRVDEDEGRFGERRGRIALRKTLEAFSRFEH